MYQIAYIGRWETLPETAVAIYEHDIPKLEALLQGGLDLGAPHPTQRIHQADAAGDRSFFGTMCP